MCFFLSRNQEDTQTTKSPPRRKPELVAWVNLPMAVGEKSTSQKFSISNRAVSGLNAMPTGYCIHPLATRIHRAERLEPMATIHVEKRWNPLDTRFHPKNMTAKKVASMKKAKMPSAARGAPKMSPTIHE